MMFTRFEALVKEKYPDAKVFKHGEYAGNKINVAIIFNGEGKAYKFNGTYCDVLNKIGIKAITGNDFKTIVSVLELAKKSHGTKHIFSGKTIDNSAKIEEYTALLDDINNNYVIV